MINESKFEALYCNDNGRPNTPVNVVIGSLILKDLIGLVDEELVDSIVLDPRFQYAQDNNINAVCYRLGKDEVQTRLESVTKDALEVFRLCGEAQFGYEEYRLLERMLGDQTKDGQLKQTLK